MQNFSTKTSHHNGSMRPARFVVSESRQETSDVVTLTLAQADDQPFAKCLPGQFNMLYAFGVGEIPVSVSGIDENFVNISHTIRAVGAVSHALTQMKSGDMLGLRGPFGSHWPLAEAKGQHIVLIAGGLGLAPLRSVVHFLLHHSQDYLSISCYIGTRAPQDIVFRKEMEQWQTHASLNVAITVDQPMLEWQGNVGMVTNLLSNTITDPAHTVAMVCGPEIMMRFSLSVLSREGLKAHQMYVSMERNMPCAIGLCGHCQFGPHFICKDGPIFCYERIASFFDKKAL